VEPSGVPLIGSTKGNIGMFLSGEIPKEGGHSCPPFRMSADSNPVFNTSRESVEVSARNATLTSTFPPL